MADKPMKIPGPDHPISIDANPSRIVVTVGGKVIADTRDALTLREASYPAVQYIPRRDVDMAALTRSEHTTYCPYKGDASYHSIPAGGDRSLNAVWTYEAPFKRWRRSRITSPSTRTVSTRGDFTMISMTALLSTSFRAKRTLSMSRSVSLCSDSGSRL
jgi:uncharacterized protein (DUF427 family)